MGDRGKCRVDIDNLWETVAMYSRYWQMYGRQWQMYSRYWQMYGRQWQMYSRYWQMYSRYWQMYNRNKDILRSFERGQQYFDKQNTQQGLGRIK